MTESGKWESEGYKKESCLASETDSQRRKAAWTFKKTEQSNRMTKWNINIRGENKDFGGNTDNITRQEEELKTHASRE